jgi:hypothetical protein
MSSIKKHICAYCGSVDKLTIDHVPPKNLFPKPRPPDLIKVLACIRCHSHTSKDDEYFRIKICMKDDVKSHPATSTVLDTVFRSLLKSNAAGLRKRVLSDMQWVNLRTTSGLYIGRRFGYSVDLNRIRSVLERTIRGLYFVELGKPLGLNNEVRVFTDGDIELQPNDVLEQLKQGILKPLSTCSPKVIGNGVFSYRHQIVKENPLLSVWLLLFYGGFPALAMTGPLRQISIGGDA